MRSTKLGVIYNDQMWDAVNLWVNEFNLKADTMRPRKRPMSLASPSIVLDEDGNVRMVIGAAGGKYIATALAQVSSTTIKSNLGRFSSYFSVVKELFFRRICARADFSGILIMMCRFSQSNKSHPCLQQGLLNMKLSHCFS